MGEKRRARRRRRRNRSRIARATVKPRNEVKLSAAIERMIRPYLQDGLDLVQHRVLVGLCAIAWDLEVMDYQAKSASPELRSAVEKASATAHRLGVTATIEELRKRKTLLFPDDERLIIDTSLQPMDESNRYLKVASTKLDGSRTTQA